MEACGCWQGAFGYPNPIWVFKVASSHPHRCHHLITSSHHPRLPLQRKDNVPSGSLAAAYPGGGVLFVTYSLLVSKVRGGQARGRGR